MVLLATLLAALAPGLPAVQARAAQDTAGPGPVEAQAPVYETDLPPGVPAGWWAAVQQDIRQSEYEITWQESTRPLAVPDVAAAYQAPNRAQGLRTYFTPEGIVVVPRVDAVAWRLDLRVATEGAHGGAPLQVDGNRIEYRYADGVVAYANTEAGLEQRVTLAASPGRAGGIALELALDTDLAARLTADGTAVELADAAGAAVLRYVLVGVTDAGGQALAARLGMTGQRLRLIVEGEQSTYPLTVTTLLAGAGPEGLSTTANWTAEGNQADAQFGRSVGTAGDVNGDGYADVIVGAPYYDNGEADEGRAYVYHGSATGLATTANWTAESDQASAFLGRSVGTAGDVNGDGYADVIVGANAYDNTETDEGMAFVWYGSANGVNNDVDGTPANAAWTAESNQDNAYFGYSAGTAGDVNGDGYADVIVGAHWYDNGETDEGAALVWYGSSTGLGANGTPANADWTAESDQINASFGYSAGTAGDVNGDGYADVIVGAYFYDNGEADEGRAYVYHGSATGLATTANWTAESNQVSAQFGWSVRMAGDVNGDGYGDVIVGAYAYDNPDSNEGAAFVWYGSASGLGANGTPANAGWTAESNQAAAYFGYSVGTAGDVNGDGYADVIVGARYYDNGETDEGRAFVYHGSASGLPATANWTAEGNQGSAYFGWSVGTAGDVNGDGYADVIVGAHGYDNGETDEGGAWVYHGAADGLSATANWTYSTGTSIQLGYAVASAGDVNGDGYGDVVVGAIAYQAGQASEGMAYVFYGSATGLSTPANWTAESNQSGATLGRSVGTAGDVNGDGYDDVIVGADGYDNTDSNEGAAFVWYGSSTGLGANGTPANADWTAESDQAGALLGWSVGTAGDVNGDGYADVIVGAYQYDNTDSNEGAAFVWYGSSSGLGANGTPANADWTAESNQASANFGWAAGTAGDVNGDGYADVIVGARQYDNGYWTDEGAAFVWYGSAHGVNNDVDGTPLNAAWMAEGNQNGAQFGYSVGTAGDVNGDGYADVIVGAMAYDNVENGEGRAFVFPGAAGGLSTTVAWTAESNQGNAYLGWSVGTAGDVNGDGYDDVITGAYWYDNPDSNEGAAFVWHGSASGLGASGTPANADWTGEGNLAGAQYGWSVRTAGDVNGDGYADAIVGANLYSSSQGRAYVYYGNAGGGLDVRPRQRRADGSAPVAPGGQSISPTEARLAALARTPFGRSQVRLEWEVKPEGTAFDGSGLGQSAWQDGGTAGYAFDELVSSLSFETRYHWRARIAGRPANAATNSVVTYRSRWLRPAASTFFTALSGEQAIGGTGQTNLLSQAAYVNVTNQGSLTGLTLRGYPQTAHEYEDLAGRGPLVPDRYFTLTPNSGASGFDLTLCLNYDDAELGTVDETDLMLCRWTGTEYACPARSGASDTTSNLACADHVTQLSDWVVAGANPTAVELARFEAWPAGGAIHVGWETVTEVDIVGFYLYRSESADGEYARLNEALIPAQAPGGPSGAVYAWEDGGVEPGTTYYYRLEVIDVAGQGQLFGPVAATAGSGYRAYLPLVGR